MPVEVLLKENTYDASTEGEFIKKYDEDLSRYHATRSVNKKISVWSKQMSDKLSTESRAHMKTFLTDRGFLKR